jgi:putative hemolysin
VRALLRECPVVSDQADALDVIDVLQRSADNFALVYDEYGHFEGIVTTSDVLEAITGSERAIDGEEPALIERTDGSLLISGWMPVDEFCDRMGLPRALAGEFDTVAGLVLHQMRRIPQLGEEFLAEGFRFEIMDMDGLRVDKVLVTRIPV